MPEDDKYLDANEYLTIAMTMTFWISSTNRRVSKSSPIALCDVHTASSIEGNDWSWQSILLTPKTLKIALTKVTSQFTVDELLAMQFNGKKESRAYREHKTHRGE